MYPWCKLVSQQIIILVLRTCSLVLWYHLEYIRQHTAIDCSSSVVIEKLMLPADCSCLAAPHFTPSLSSQGWTWILCCPSTSLTFFMNSIPDVFPVHSKSHLIKSDYQAPRNFHKYYRYRTEYNKQKPHFINWRKSYAIGPCHWKLEKEFSHVMLNQF